MGFSRAWAWLAGAAYAGHMTGRTMKGSRNRSVPVVAAMAALGLGIAAVSCAGSGEKTPPAKADDKKTSGPAIAKGDKVVEKPGAGQPAAAGKTPPAPAKTEPKPAEPAKTEPKPAETAKTEPKAAEPAPAPAKPADTAKAEPKPDGTAKAPEAEPVPPPRPGAPLPPPVKDGEAKAGAAPAKAPGTEAERILQQRVKELELEKEKRAVLVATYVQNAQDAAQQNKWDECAEWASKAVESDHANAEAQRLLRQARAAQGYRDADVASISDLMIQSAKVKREQARFTGQSEWDAAQKAKSEQRYAEAIQHLELALAVIQNDPAGGDWGSREREIKNAIEDMQKLKAAADTTARSQAAREAYKKVKEEEAKRRLADIEKKNAILKAAMEAFESEQYARAETLLAGDG